MDLSLFDDKKLNKTCFLTKAILIVKSKFGKSIYYKKEKARSYKFTTFFRNHFWFFLILLILTLCLLFAFFVTNKKHESLGIDYISFYDLFGVLLSFVSSTFLGIIVYYNSWAQSLRENLKYSLSYRIETIDNWLSNPDFIGFTKEKISLPNIKYQASTGISAEKCNYIQLAINNYNHLSPMRIKIEKAYIQTGKDEIQQVPFYAFADFDPNKDLLEFNNTKNICIGFNNEIFNQNKVDSSKRFRYFILFSVSNLDGEIAYCLHQNILHRKGSYTPNSESLVKKDFDRLIKKYDKEILLDFGFQIKIGKKLYNKTDLYI